MISTDCRMCDVLQIFHFWVPRSVTKIRYISFVTITTNRHIDEYCLYYPVFIDAKCQPKICSPLSTNTKTVARSLYICLSQWNDNNCCHRCYFWIIILLIAVTNDRCGGDLRISRRRRRRQRRNRGIGWRLLGPGTIWRNHHHRYR